MPLQQVFLRMPLRRAIANSAATILPLSLIGAICKNYANARAGVPLPEALKLALFLIPTAIIGGLLGGRLTHLLPRWVLRVAVILLMCYAGVSLIRRSGRPERPATVPAGRHNVAGSRADGTRTGGAGLARPAGQGVLAARSTTESAKGRPTGSPISGYGAAQMVPRRPATRSRRFRHATSQSSFVPFRVRSIAGIGLCVSGDSDWGNGPGM